MPIKLLAHCLKIRLWLVLRVSEFFTHPRYNSSILQLSHPSVSFHACDKTPHIYSDETIQLTYHSAIYTPYSFEQTASSLRASTSPMELTVLHQSPRRSSELIPIKHTEQQGRWKTPSATLGREARAGWRHCNTQTCDREVGKIEKRSCA